MTFLPDRIMAIILSCDAATARSLISEKPSDCKQDLRRFSKLFEHSDSGNENKSDCPIFDAFFLDGGSESIPNVTNLNAKHFTNFYGRMHGYITRDSNAGCRLKSALSYKDVLFMLLGLFEDGG